MYIKSIFFFILYFWSNDDDINVKETHNKSGSATLILTIFHQSNLLRLSFPPTLSFFIALNHLETQKKPFFYFLSVICCPLSFKCNGN